MVFEVQIAKIAHTHTRARVRTHARTDNNNNSKNNKQTQRLNMKEISKVIGFGLVAVTTTTIIFRDVMTICSLY
jgi:hypothetical protein